MTLVVGVDLSLTATGIARVRLSGVKTATLSSKHRGISRLRDLAYEIRCQCDDADLVVIEGPSYGSVGAGFHERAGLHWLVVDLLSVRDIPYVIVPPSVVKKYATGKGNANKGAMIDAATRRYPHIETGGDDNQVDALWLAAMGLDYLTDEHAVPESHRATLNSVTWPDIKVAL